MKRIFITIISATILFFSCKKEGNDRTEKLCPVIDASAIPMIVKDSFSIRYPANNVITWFKKDSIAFCAYFITSTSVEKLVHFANNGSFIKEEIAIQQEGEHEDSTGSGDKVESGCKCETQQEGD